jgi:hypothetical protein
MDWPVSQIKTKIASSHSADSKRVKQEVNGTMILPPFSIPCTNTLAYFADVSIKTKKKKSFVKLSPKIKS